MFKARYYKVDGTEGKARALPEVLFDGVVNEPVLHRAVKAYRNNQRQGTGAGKNRSAARGGSRKPWRQKGTGRARQGTIRAPQWAGGGRAFPPIPHSWREKLPRKMKALARRSAFNARAEEDRVVLVDAPALEAPRTREVRAFLDTLEVADRKVLFLTHGLNRTLHLSARNLPKVILCPFGEEAPYDILWADVVIIERGALDALEDGGDEGGSAGAAVVEDEEVAEEAAPEEPEAEEEPEAAAEDDAAEDDAAEEPEAAAEEATAAEEAPAEEEAEPEAPEEPEAEAVAEDEPAAEAAPGETEDEAEDEEKTDA